MSRRISPTLSAILVVAGAAAANAQGLYWESKMSGGPPGLGGVEMTSKNYATPGLFKQSSDVQGATIVRTKEEIIQGVDSRKKTYWEMSFTEMEGEMKKVEAQMSEALEQMEKQLAALPPEQRKAVEKQFEGQKAFLRKSGSGKVEVSSSDEKKTIAGYSATKYVVKEDGKDVGTVWASTDVKGYKPIQKELAAVAKRMSSPGSKALGEAFLKIDGFPLETDIGGVKNSVTKVEERAIPPAEFEVPKDFKKEDSPFSKMRGPGGPGAGPGRKPAEKGKSGDKVK